MLSFSSVDRTLAEWSSYLLRIGAREASCLRVSFAVFFLRPLFLLASSSGVQTPPELATFARFLSFLTDLFDSSSSLLSSSRLFPLQSPLPFFSSNHLVEAALLFFFRSWMNLIYRETSLQPKPLDLHSLPVLLSQPQDSSLLLLLVLLLSLLALHTRHVFSLVACRQKAGDGPDRFLFLLSSASVCLFLFPSSFSPRSLPSSCLLFVLSFLQDRGMRGGRELCHRCWRYPSLHRVLHLLSETVQNHEVVRKIFSVSGRRRKKTALSASSQRMEQNKTEEWKEGNKNSGRRVHVQTVPGRTPSEDKPTVQC